MPENPESSKGLPDAGQPDSYKARQAEARAWELFAEAHAYLACGDGTSARRAVEIAAIQYRDAEWYAGTDPDIDTGDLVERGLEIATDAASDDARLLFSS